MKDTDLLNYKCTTKIEPSFDIDKQILELETITDGMMKNHYKEVIDFKDECVRQALIALGWTPPIQKVEGE